MMIEFRLKIPELRLTITGKMDSKAGGITHDLKAKIKTKGDMEIRGPLAGLILRSISAE